MNALYETTENFVFFLQLTEKLPVNYFYLSTHFSEMGITLLPITLEELMKLKNGSKEYVLTLVNDTAAQRGLNNFRERYLDFLLLSRKVCLFNVSSFSKIDIAVKCEYLGTYHHFALPVKVSEIAEKVAQVIGKDSKSETVWPGGKRSKLPTDLAS